MKLYHNNMSVCAQKVRLVLKEKGLEPEEVHMMLRDGDVHRPEYLKLNPKGVVPTLIDKDEVVVESTIICEYLEDAYPAPALRPADPGGRAKMRQWTLLPDAGLHNACGILSVAIAFRHQMLASGGEQLKNRPNFGDSNSQLQQTIDHGLEYDRVPPAVQVYDQAIEKMASALRDGREWLCGDQYTLADASMTPYVCRLKDLSLPWFWEGERSPVGEWFDRVQARANYSAVRDYQVAQYLKLVSEKGKEASPHLRKMLHLPVIQ